ncbi:hypothetical protein [Mesorhizobium sp. Root695]|uniref:hypothetical protein n=1 Tax=Mesorhizobium sp. Root695 TaxID=1736589 RepID=UPI0012E3BEBB|nr:hypothetical protein [Mesorhizobium sp. Root695]
MVKDNLKEPKPELLLERSERTLRIILRAIVRGYPDEQHRTDEARVAQAVAILLGRKSQRGAPGLWRDDMLEMMAFMYSVAAYAKRPVAVEKLANAVIDMPGGAGKDPEGAVAKDLVRKFNAHRDELLAAHSFDGREDFGEFYNPIADVFDGLRRAGVAIDNHVIPMGARRRR